MPVWPTCENGMLGYVAMWCSTRSSNLKENTVQTLKALQYYELLSFYVKGNLGLATLNIFQTTKINILNIVLM